MKQLLTFTLLLFLQTALWGQDSDTLKLSQFKLCELMFDDLLEIDPHLKKVDVEEKLLCEEGFVIDSRFQNRIGYTSNLFPGVNFQRNGERISKLSLTTEFKGELPDGNYVDLSIITAEEILKLYPEFDTWGSSGCSKYWKLTDGSTYFYVEIDNSIEPRYPINKEHYLKQRVVGVDIIKDCWTNEKKENTEPLIILDGKEIEKSKIESLLPESIESITILKDQNAIDKYGEKGKNGVVIIITKKK